MSIAPTRAPAPDAAPWMPYNPVILRMAMYRAISQSADQIRTPTGWGRHSVRRAVAESVTAAVTPLLNTLQLQKDEANRQLANVQSHMRIALEAQDRNKAEAAVWKEQASHYQATIHEARRQHVRAETLAAALDEVLRRFTEQETPSPFSGTWLVARISETDLTRLRELLPTTRSRRSWRTQMVTRTQLVEITTRYEGYRRRDSEQIWANTERLNHLAAVEERHRAELVLRTQAETQLRELTATHSTAGAELADTKRRLTKAQHRAKVHWDARYHYHRRWKGTIAEARQQHQRAETAQAQIRAMRAERADERLAHSEALGAASRRIADLEQQLAAARTRPTDTTPTVRPLSALAAGLSQPSIYDTVRLQAAEAQRHASEAQAAASEARTQFNRRLALEDRIGSVQLWFTQPHPGLTAEELNDLSAILNRPSPSIADRLPDRGDEVRVVFYGQYLERTDLGDHVVQTSGSPLATWRNFLPAGSLVEVITR